MKLVTVDALSLETKNGGMAHEDRQRIGRKLRAMRVERGLHQAQVAPKVGLGVGTLQAIEGAWYEVRETNVEKLARFYGTTMAKLLKSDEPKVVTPDNPLLKGLNEEHLEIAHGYKDARKRVRACIELLLNHREEERLTNIILKLDNASSQTLARVETLLAAEPDDPILEIAERILQSSPQFRIVLKNTLDDELLKKQAAEERATKKPGAKSVKKQR